VDDEVVKHRLATSPEFQLNGRFLGGDEIRRRLERQGTSVREFEDSLRASILRERLISLVTDGVKVTPAEAEEEYRRRNEQIKAEYVLVPANQAGVAASDDEVKARFEADKDRYKFPERRVLSYVAVDAPTLQPRVTLTERDKQAWYEAHRDEMAQPEELCASHVLIKIKSSPTAAEGHTEEEALRLARAVQAELAAGADFAAVARKSSEDLGSAPQGGDLGCFPRGRMVPEFDTAAFALAPGQTSELVRTNFGYHVIKAISKKDEAVPPYAQVKDQIQGAALSERVQALAREKANAISAALRAGRRLEDAAREQDLTVQKTEPLARGQSRPPLSSSALLARDFEMKKGETAPEAFPVNGGFAFIAVDDVQPPRAAQFDEVKDKVKADLMLDKGYQAARATADALRARAEKDGLEKAAAAASLVRKQTDALVSRGQPLGDLGAGAGLEKAWSLPVGALSPPLKTPAGWAVVRVLEKKEFDPAAYEKEKASLMSSLAEQRKGQLFQAYMQEARKRFPVLRRPDVMQRVASS
jgi:peptidyl-prolyl cis-trans isomerase D